MTTERTQQEIAALNSAMDHEAICYSCAQKKGGVFPDSHVATGWIGTCMICREATGCTSVRDFRWPGGVRPTCRPIADRAT